MNDKKIRKLVLAALLAALVCVATMVVQIPSPMQGYVNLGDCFVLLSGWLLGPWYGFAAGGIGSMLADIFLGYAHYAPGTLVIKGVMALVAALMYEKMGRTATSRIAGGVVSEIIMVLGYFGYASLLLGKGLAAAASIPGNIFQGAVGLVVGVLLVDAGGGGRHLPRALQRIFAHGRVSCRPVLRAFEPRADRGARGCAERRDRQRPASAQGGQLVCDGRVQSVPPSRGARRDTRRRRT